MVEPRRYFSAGEVVKLTGITYRRLDVWCRRGIIRPSGRDAKGKGKRRLFTFRDVVEVQTLKALTAEGVRLGALIQCANQIHSDLPDVAADIERSFGTMRLISDGKTIYRYVAATSALESLDGYGQFAFAFSIGEAVSRLYNHAKSFNRNSRYVRGTYDADSQMGESAPRSKRSR